MFINVTTRQQISIYSIAPTDICLLVPPHLEKWGVQKKFIFARSARDPVLYPHLKIRGAAHDQLAVRWSGSLGSSVVCSPSRVQGGSPADKYCPTV